MKSSSENRLLPSLLDRLTDDKPANDSLSLQGKIINDLEKSLIRLQKNNDKLKDETQDKSLDIRSQLDIARKKYNLLASSINSLSDLRDCVKRDLDWLLNARQYSPQEDLDDYPEVKSSVINYGLPDLTGKTASGIDLRVIERLLKQALLDFEPRIIRRTLIVRLIKDEAQFNHNAISFEIRGELWAEPLPLLLHLRTEFELENGSVSVVDFNH